MSKKLAKTRLSVAGKKFQPRAPHYDNLTLRVEPSIAYRLRAMAINENITLQAAMLNCLLHGLAHYEPRQEEFKFD